MSTPEPTHSALSSKASWVALALLGIVVAVAISIAASRLSSQRIGLSSEPLSAGRQLAPSAAAPRSGAAATHHPGGTGSSGWTGHAPTSTAPSPPPQATTPAPQPAAPVRGGGESEAGGGSTGGDD